MIIIERASDFVAIDHERVVEVERTNVQVITVGGQGPAGVGIQGPPGIGDMVGANNLSELTDIAAAKTKLELENVDNTADDVKPVSTAQAAADAAVQSAAASDATAKANAVAAASAPVAHVGAGGAAHANAVAAGAAGFMTGADKTKLDGIATGANNYTHPANHPPSIITQDASNRFVSDAEKTTWSAKEPAITGDVVTKFWAGTKVWRDLATDVRAIVLTGLSLATGGAIAATDTLLVALGKIQKQITDLGVANTGDETGATIRTKLGIATLSGSNTGDQALPTKSSLGLSNVDNTSDANKPVSTAQQTALDLKLNAASPSSSGTLTHSGDILLSGSGKRITGDFSNATLANRVMFQTSVANGSTSLGVIPNGSVSASTTASQVVLEDNTSISTGNGSIGQLANVQGSDLRLQASIRGSGTYLPMTFYTSGSERMQIGTDGNVGIGDAGTPGYLLHLHKSNSGAINWATVHNSAAAAGSNAGFLAFAQGGGGNNYSTMYQDTSGSFNIANSQAGGTILLQSLAALYINVNGAERFRIDSSGNVGIGATAPANTKLYSLSGAGVTVFTAIGPAADMVVHYLGTGVNYIDGGQTTFRNYGATVNNFTVSNTDVSVRTPIPLGYGTGAGGTVTQATSRTTGVTLSKPTGAITLFTAAGSATPASFTVTNTLVGVADLPRVAVKSGTNKYIAHVTAVAAGSFEITFWTTGGTASDAPVFTVDIGKGATS